MVEVMARRMSHWSALFKKGQKFSAAAYCQEFFKDCLYKAADTSKRDWICVQEEKADCESIVHGTSKPY